MKRMQWMIKSLGCGLLLLAAAAPAKADFIYTYVGDDFNTFIGSYANPPYTNLTLDFVLPTPIGDSFDGTIDPESWSVSDGVNDLTNLSPNISPDTSFTIQTNASGVIIGWDIEIIQNLTSPAFLELRTNSLTAIDETDDCSSSLCSPPADSAYIEYQSSLAPSGPTQPGFTVVDVPEPRLTLALGAILTVLAFAGWRKKAVA